VKALLRVDDKKELSNPPRVQEKELNALQGYYANLQQNQTTSGWRDRMLDFDQLNQVIGTPELMSLGAQYADPSAG